MSIHSRRKTARPFPFQDPFATPLSGDCLLRCVFKLPQTCSKTGCFDPVFSGCVALLLITVHRVYFPAASQSQMVIFPICSHNLLNPSHSESYRKLCRPKAGVDEHQPDLGWAGFGSVVLFCESSYEMPSAEKLLFSSGVCSV
jgi:hypothetical protein